MAETYHSFRFSESNIFRTGLEIPIGLIPLKKLAFLAQAISRRRGPDARDESVRIDQTDLPRGKSVMSLRQHARSGAACCWGLAENTGRAMIAFAGQ